MALKLESSMTDLMTSLAVVFIMLMLALAQNNAKGSITNIKKISESINKELKKDNLECVIKKEDPLACTIELKEDKLKFLSGSYFCDNKCETFLKQTFAEEIMNILLNSSEFKKNIQGVYIEGFTDDVGDDIANLNLSQNRSLSIGRYIVEYYKNQKSPDEYETLLKWLYLNGRGEQNKKCLPKTNNSCDEESQSAFIDRDASRRVEITIRVKSSEQRKAIESKVKGLK
jgi:outer membrane protein OmpA-like peptidoglycan-associated protein